MGILAEEEADDNVRHQVVTVPSLRPVFRRFHPAGETNQNIGEIIRKRTVRYNSSDV